MSHSTLKNSSGVARKHRRRRNVSPSDVSLTKGSHVLTDEQRAVDSYLDLEAEDSGSSENDDNDEDDELRG